MYSTHKNQTSGLFFLKISILNGGILLFGGFSFEASTICMNENFGALFLANFQPTPFPNQAGIQFQCTKGTVFVKLPPKLSHPSKN